MTKLAELEARLERTEEALKRFIRAEVRRPSAYLDGRQAQVAADLWGYADLEEPDNVDDKSTRAESERAERIALYRDARARARAEWEIATYDEKLRRLGVDLDDESTTDA